MNQQEWEKFEEILKTKPSLKVPEWNRDIFYKQPKYNLKTRTYDLEFAFYSKIAASIFFFLLIGFLVFQQFFYKNVIPVVENKTQNAVVGIAILVKGNVFLKEKSNKTKIRAGDIIQNTSYLEVGPDSEIQILLKNNSQIRISENSKIQIYYEKKRWKILQEQGLSFHNVNLRNKEKYKIVTPTIIAGVRGTFFKVLVQSNFEEIKTLKGKLEVLLENKESESILLEGIISEKIKDENKKNFLKIDSKKKKISLNHANYDELFVIFNRMNEVSNGFLDKNPNVWDEIDKIKVVENPDDLEKIYNRRIEILKLYNGIKWKGIIVSQIGDSIILHTIEGVKIIKTNEILEIQYEEN